jgi:hypothetical protein
MKSNILEDPEIFHVTFKDSDLIYFASLECGLKGKMNFANISFNATGGLSPTFDIEWTYHRCRRINSSSIKDGIDAMIFNHLIENDVIITQSDAFHKIL